MLLPIPLIANGLCHGKLALLYDAMPRKDTYLISPWILSVLQLLRQEVSVSTCSFMLVKVDG